MKKIILIATALFLGLSAVAQEIPAGNWFIKGICSKGVGQPCCITLWLLNIKIEFGY